jgi:hypothetical protein
VLIAFVNKHRPHLVQALALVAVGCMVLSAYFFHPQPDSLVRYRPTPGPKDYYDPRAPWFFVIGALALFGSLALVRRVVPSRPLAGGKLDALWPLWAWVLVVPGVALLFVAAEINGQMVAALDWMWRASPHVQFALLVAGTALLVGGLGGLSACRGRARPAQFGRPKGRPYEDRMWEGHSLPKTSPPGPLSTRGEGEARAETEGSEQVPPPIRWERGFRGEGRLLRLEIALVLLLTVIALAVRLYELRDSVRTMIDEIHFAFGVTYFWKFPDVNLFEPMPTTAAFPFIF